MTDISSWSWKCLDSTTSSGESTDDKLVLKRSSHAISVVNNTLYLLGGEHIARTPIDSTFYTRKLTETKADSWKSLGKKEVEPSPRVAHAQAVVSDYIYIFGGRQGIDMSESPLNDLWKFHTTTQKWTKLEDVGTPPSPRSFHKMVSIGTKLYVFGGCGAKGRLNDLHCFDTEKGSWTKPLSEEDVKGLKGRGGPGFIPSSDGKALFVVGGFKGEESNAIFKFDLTSNKWSEIYKEGNDTLRPFSVSAGGLMGDHIVFFGGEVNPSEKGHEGAGSFSNNLLVLDGKSGKVLSQPTITSTPPNRGWSCAAVWNASSLIVFAGLAGDDTNPIRLDDTWLLSKGAKVKAEL